jgi:hypothetical protein
MEAEPEKTAAASAKEGLNVQAERATAPEPVAAPEEGEQGDRGSAAGASDPAQPKKGMRR